MNNQQEQTEFEATLLSEVERLRTKVNSLDQSDYNLAAETMLRHASALKIEQARYTSNQPIFLINAKAIRSLESCAAKMMAAADQRTDAVDYYLEQLAKEAK